MGVEESETRHRATPIVSRVEGTHARIRGDLEALQHAADVQVIRAVVEDLPGLLREHFDDEEKPDGLFDELRGLRPVVESQIKFLQQEHREIMQALEDLQRQFQEADQVTTDGELEHRHDHIRVSADAFLNLVRHHERIESGLVAETFYTDDGGSG